jgi:hypothetical protein
MVSSKLSVCTKVGKKFWKPEAPVMHIYADVDEGGSKSQFEGFKLAMTDVKTYVFALAYMC